MIKIQITENFFACPKSVIIGNSGEIGSRKIYFDSPAVSGANVYICRFLMPDGVTVYETIVQDNICKVPAIVLYEIGKGYMQWVARDSTGQLIAKSNLISAFDFFSKCDL